MEATFKIWKKSRNIYMSFLENYTLEQLNKIPEGMSNNLIWNIGHIIVSQQRLSYLLSGLPSFLQEEFTNKYINGSVPDGKSTIEDVSELKHLLEFTYTKTINDFEKGKFINYTETQTKVGFLLSNFEEGMAFNNYHEGIHLGFMMKIKRFL